MDLLKIIKRAAKEGKAIGHFNVGSFDMLKAVAHVAEKFDAPIVIGVSEGERAYLGVHHAADMIRSYNREHGHRLFLNADHTRTLEGAIEAARAGCDMIVFDAADKPFAENIRATREAVRAVRRARRGVLVEGELGYIGASSGIFEAMPQGAIIREEDMPLSGEAEQFVKETGVDLLAPAVGNVHGMFKNAPSPALNIGRIMELRNAVAVPLVLHGGSGITDADMRAAIRAGIAMVHVSTELRLTWRRALEEALAARPEELTPYKLMPSVLEAMEKLISRKMELFGSPHD